MRFYTKLNCPACDEAYNMLVTVALDIPLNIDVVDITHPHNGLETAYADLIPVIIILDQNQELTWPFSVEEIKSTLSH
ncbi:MAG: glutaredoxin family protein [Anaerolineae bacterium]|nr:glutaredoxin family protein [Anaerolineae bacterium]